jgi:trans-aconitate 2-methyltransferase
MAAATTDWDAERYDRLAAPQEEWGRATLERLPLTGAETVLDAGCGSGRVTRLLADRLPQGRVVAVDGSPSMIETAGEALADRGERVDLVLSDLTELDLPEPVDAVFSNATFHWIADHDLLFRRLHDVLRPGGRLVAQCGGAGNVAEWQEAVAAACRSSPFAPSFQGWTGPWNFAGPEATEERLRAAGFEDVSAWLEERVVEPEDPRDFVAVSGLAAHHERLPGELREAFTDAVLAQLQPPLRLRYVRLNIDARKPG